MSLSLALMVSDFHFHYTAQLRLGLSMISMPIQYTVDYPLRVIGFIKTIVSSRTALVSENMQLQYQQLLLEAKLQKLTVLQQENSQLRELLQTASNNRLKTMAAHVLAVETNSARQLIVVNLGSRDGVYEGQPVLDAKGVVGQAIEVGLYTSTIMMITDSQSAIPVRNNRTADRAIMVGGNDVGGLSLINVPNTSSFEEGDLLVTSGLGSRYPEGFPVGTIQSVKSLPGEQFLQVLVRPAAQLNKDRLVLMVWPDSAGSPATLAKGSVH